MRVLVTGAAGFIGSWLCDILREKGHEVTGYDNCWRGTHGKTLPHDWHGNIRDLAVLSAAASDCEAVYHCAALPYEGLSVFSPACIVENVVAGSVNVAVAAVRTGAKRLINCSSMARYGGGSPPFREDKEPTPEDPYGLAKWQAEQQLNLIGRVHGLKVLHAVPHNVYGPRQRYDDPYRNVAAIFANLLLQGKQPVIYGDGKQMRCFSCIGDILPVMVALLDCEAEHGEVFNVGPDQDWSTINELYEIVAGAVGTDIKPQYLPPRPCEVKWSACSSDKIRKRFGWKEGVSLRDGIAELVEWIRKTGPKPFNYHLPIEIDSPAVPRTWKERMF